MTSKEILEKYFEFFAEKKHKKIPNVSLVPENDPTLLFVNSGMFPLVPYLSGETHPEGNRLINVQRCIRFDDLEEIGDHIHTLTFHMIGNWSLGDYFKKEQLPWIYEFFVEVLGLDINKMYGSVFKGDDDAPKDEESIALIKEIFSKYGIDAKEGERIYAYGKSENWWQRGDAVGELGGPDSEVFYYIGKEGNGFGKDPAKNPDEFVEIGNSVFMQYKKTKSGWEELPQKNVDFGGGLERIALAVQGKGDIYLTDNFYPLIKKLEEISGSEYGNSEKETFAMRNIADHLRGSVFLAMDGVLPSNKDQGYVLRRLLRRMVRFGKDLGVEQDLSASLVPVVVNSFSWLYPDLVETEKEIVEIFSKEEEKFRGTLERGSKKFKKLFGESLQDYCRNWTPGEDLAEIATLAFNVFQSDGYPYEMVVRDVEEINIDLHPDFFWKLEEEFRKEVSKHQDKSRTGAEQKFKGGLADHSEQVVKYHTATHLLHLALRKVLGDEVVQHGSNITGERLRFDFNFDRKLSQEELLEVEKIINEAIKSNYPVNFEVLPLEEAEKTGAIHAFGEKYGDQVKVYYIGESLENAVSKEFCGGPHVENTSEIGEIEIFKQDKIGEGKMRIYARNKN